MNAIIYSRVSTLDQDNQRQIDELIRYAEAMKYNLLAVFEEKITGASKASERLEFKKLLDFINNNKVDHLLVWELSRIGRSMKIVSDVIDELSEKKVNIFIKKEGMNTLDSKGKKSTMTSMLISILSGFAEMERETIKARSISGIRANVAKGGSGTGIVKAYGYKRVDKKLLIDENESEVVKLIYKKYLSGLGSLAIANYLNTEGIPTKFNTIYKDKLIKQKYSSKNSQDYKWKDGTIYSILTNSIYCGKRKHKGEVFDCPAIIDELTFNKVQQLLTSKYNKKDIHRTYDNPLSNLLICGKCGQGYFMHKRADNTDNAYKCLSKRYGEYCGNPSINIDKLQDALFKVCQPLIYSDAIEKGEVQANLNEQISNKKILIKNAEKNIEKINKQSDNLIKLNIAGSLSVEEFTKFKTELTDEKIKEENLILKLTTELESLARLNNLNFDNDELYSKDMFNNYVKDAVDHIKIYDLTNFKDKFKEVYPAKHDVIMLIEVKSKLDFIDDSPVFYHFTLSRWTNNFSTLSPNIVDDNYLNQINSGKFEVDFSIDLKDFIVLKGLKNHLIKKRGSITKPLKKYIFPKAKPKNK